MQFSNYSSPPHPIRRKPRSLLPNQFLEVRVGMVGVYRGHGKGVVVGQLLDG